MTLRTQGVGGGGSQVAGTLAPRQPAPHFLLSNQTVLLPMLSCGHAGQVSVAKTTVDFLNKWLLKGRTCDAIAEAAWALGQLRAMTFIIPNHPQTHEVK